MKSNQQLLAEQVTGWDYEARRYIVLISVPKLRDYKASDVADETLDARDNRELSKVFAAQHVFEESTPPVGLHVPIGSNKRIPPSRIIGYWDDKAQKLHLNPLWKSV